MKIVRVADSDGAINEMKAQNTAGLSTVVIGVDMQENAKVTADVVIAMEGVKLTAELAAIEAGQSEGTAAEANNVLVEDVEPFDAMVPQEESYVEREEYDALLVRLDVAEQAILAAETREGALKERVETLELAYANIEKVQKELGSLKKELSSVGGRAGALERDYAELQSQCASTAARVAFHGPSGQP